MKHPITLQWSNTCTTSTPTEISIQRCSNVHFRHPKATIKTLIKGNRDGLDPLQNTGWYIDNDIELNNSYCYRILTHRDSESAASVITDFIYNYDIVSELGYPTGVPEQTYTYNINYTPVIHVDANRTTGSLCECNDKINNIESSLRSNKIIENITTVGDVILDSDNIQKIICKTQTPNNLENETRNIIKTHLNFCVSENITYNNFTVFGVVYCGYENNTQNTYEIVPGINILWSKNNVTFSLESGTRKVSRDSDEQYYIFCIRVTPEQTHAWENSRRIYRRKHLKNKNKCTWTPRKQYDILPNSKKQIPAGLCEYIVFDDALSTSNMSVVNQYLSKKYNISNSNIDITDL
jgi:hypothetical protein